MSKGGDSSNSASAQTPSQWASALSNASISAWKEADILSFSVAQLQALTPGQISNIRVPWAVPMAVWTADTLNAVPLQYWSQWGTRYLSTTSNGVTSITPLSQSSNGAVSGKNNWFDDVGYNTTSNGFAFTPSIVAGISNDRIAQIGAGLGHNQAHASSLATNAGYVSPSDFSAALSAATASGADVVTWNISASQTAYMFASGWADMGADFMGTLTYSQLGAIAHPESALGAAQFGYLSANQLMALGQMDWSKVTSAQLNATKISAFQGLQSHILQAISAQTWAGLDKAHTTALNAADVQLLPATTIARMNYFGYALTASVGAVLTAAQVASIPSTCWAQISDSQFLNSLSTAALQAIPMSAFASMVDTVVGSLDHVHVTALTPNQAQNYPLSKLSDASSAFYQNPNTLNFATFVTQLNVNWALAPASFIRLLTPAQLRLISPVQMAALTPKALSGLTRAQTQALSLAQIQALSASQLSAMAYISRRIDVVQEVFGASQLVQLSLSFWSNVDSNFLNALAVSAFQAITTTQLQAISAGAFANLDQAHVNALTGTQLLALTAEQVGQFNGAYLSIAFLRGVRLTAFKGLVPDQMHRLHDYLFNTVVSSAFDTTDPTLLRNAENQFASLLASILDSDDGREAWLQQSVTLLIQLRWLDATAAANLSVSDVSVTYSSLNWSWMSGTFLNSISTAVFAQIRASSVAQFNLSALAELNDTHLQALTVTQAAGLSGAQLSSISNLGALSVAVVQSLSAVQLAGIHQDWSQISAHFLNSLTASQFMGLLPAQFGQLTAEQLASTAIDWRLISPAQLNALSLSEFGNLCTGANPTILNTTVGVLLGLGGEQTAILAQAATHYSAVQMNTLLNRLFGAFSNEQTSRLIALMQNDTADQIVLQSGLVALLAQMDGSTDGIEAAIQTLVSLRQMQPDWFSAENLSAVLPALSAQYTSYLQAYQAGITTQSLYNYVFLSQSLTNLLQARQGAGLAGQSRTAMATSTSLALGNLLAMIGAGINSLGQAIEASSDNKLSKKERDSLIASASLNAIAAVAQGLQLGVNVVLQALARRYTGGVALDAVDLNAVQAVEQLLPEAVAAGLQARPTATVDLPEVEAQGHYALVSVVDGRVVLNKALPSSPPDRTDHPTSALTPDIQFGALLGAARAEPLPPRMVGAELLGVNSTGLAVIVFNSGAEDFVSQFSKLQHGIPQHIDGLPAWMGSNDNLQMAASAIQTIVDNAGYAGTKVNQLLLYNMQGKLPGDKMSSIDNAMVFARTGSQSVAHGRFLLDNLQRFAADVWKKNALSSLQLSEEALVEKMQGIIRSLLGLPPKASLDQVASGASSVSNILQTTLRELDQGRWVTFMLDDTLSSLIWSGAVPQSDLARLQTEAMSTLQQKVDNAQGINLDMVRSSVERMMQSYTLETASEQWMRNYRAHTSALAKPHALSELTDDIKQFFTEFGVPLRSTPEVDRAVDATIQKTLVQMLIEHSRAMIDTRGNVLAGLLHTYDLTANSIHTGNAIGMAVSRDLVLQGYLHSIMESVMESSNWQESAKVLGIEIAHPVGANASATLSRNIPASMVKSIFTAVKEFFRNANIAPTEDGLLATGDPEVPYTKFAGALISEALRTGLKGYVAQLAATHYASEAMQRLINADVSAFTPQQLTQRLQEQLHAFHNSVDAAITSWKQAVATDMSANRPLGSDTDKTLRSMSVDELRAGVLSTVQTANTKIMFGAVTAWAQAKTQALSAGVDEVDGAVAADGPVANTATSAATVKQMVRQFSGALIREIQQLEAPTAFRPDTFDVSTRTGELQIYDQLQAKLDAPYPIDTTVLPADLKSADGAVLVHTPVKPSFEPQTVPMPDAAQVLQMNLALEATGGLDGGARDVRLTVTPPATTGAELASATPAPGYAAVDLGVVRRRIMSRTLQAFLAETVDQMDAQYQVLSSEDTPEGRANNQKLFHTLLGKLAEAINAPQPSQAMQDMVGSLSQDRVIIKAATDPTKIYSELTSQVLVDALVRYFDIRDSATSTAGKYVADRIQDVRLLTNVTDGVKAYLQTALPPRLPGATAQPVLRLDGNSNSNNNNVTTEFADFVAGLIVDSVRADSMNRPLALLGAAQTLASRMVSFSGDVPSPTLKEKLIAFARTNGLVLNDGMLNKYVVMNNKELAEAIVRKINSLPSADPALTVKAADLRNEFNLSSQTGTFDPQHFLMSLINGIKTTDLAFTSPPAPTDANDITRAFADFVARQVSSHIPAVSQNRLGPRGVPSASGIKSAREVTTHTRLILAALRKGQLQIDTVNKIDAQQLREFFVYHQLAVDAQGRLNRSIRLTPAILSAALIEAYTTEFRAGIEGEGPGIARPSNLSALYLENVFGANTTTYDFVPKGLATIANSGILALSAEGSQARASTELFGHAAVPPQPAPTLEPAVDWTTPFANFLARKMITIARTISADEELTTNALSAAETSLLEELRATNSSLSAEFATLVQENAFTLGKDAQLAHPINLTQQVLAEAVVRELDNQGVHVDFDVAYLSRMLRIQATQAEDFTSYLLTYIVNSRNAAPQRPVLSEVPAQLSAEAPSIPNTPRPNTPHTSAPVLEVTATGVQEDIYAVPREIMTLGGAENNAPSAVRQAGIDHAQQQLGSLKMAAMNYGMLGFALFSSVLGIAAGIAGIVYALQSTTLSWQAKAMALAMNGVRVMSSAVMLVASGAQIASSVVKGVQAAADTASIANAGFAIGNVIGITTNIAQIGIQADTLASATDSTSRLIAGLSILDSTLQLILNTVGTIALAFGPVGMAINLVTFIISALLPSTAAIATAVEYRKSYNDLTGQGLYKEAEIMYMHWQVAAMDASPIVNWTSSIYTEEMKKSQERKMDHAWLDKSAEERLLYSLRANTALKDNFDSLRAQMYAGAVALTQPLTNLSQTLTRATMLMLSQDNLSYFEGDKLATVKLAGTLNYATNSVSRAPKLLGANVNGQVLSLVFNQDLASLGSQLPNLSSFSVLVNGTAVTVSGLAVLNNVVTLSLASAVTAGQSVTFSYSDPTAGNDSKAVQNVLGVDAASIVNYSVVNGLDSDKRAPQLADAVAQDNLLTLVFDEALSTAAGKMPVRGAFSVLVNGSAVGIYTLSVHDQRVLLSLNSPIAVGATVTVSYNADYGDGALQDAAGNRVASLNAQSVENTGATSSVTASRVGWLQYDNFVASVQGTGTEAASVLNGDDYTVYANADDATSGTSRLRYLSLSNAAGEFDMLSVTRAVENNDRIWLDASNAQGVNNFAINTHDMTVWGGQGKNSYSLARPYAAQSYIVAANAWSASNNVISISGSTSDTSKKVNLDYFLSADNISGGLPVTQTAFTVLGANDGLDVVVGSGDNQSYMATSNVANINLSGANANVSVGESAQVNVGVNGRVQVDMDMWRGLNVEAPTVGVFNGVIKGNYGSYSLLNFAPTDSLNANFNGKLNLSYQIGHLPTLDAFSVYVGSTLVGVNTLSVKGKTVTLNLSSAVAQNEVVSVSYADASSADDDNTLQGLTGKDVNSFSRQAVVNTTADTTAPKLAVATVQGNSLIVHFSEALQQSYQPLNSAWAVYVNGTRVAVTRVAFNDSSSLRLTLASAVNAGQMVNLNYSAASDTSLAVQDLAGNITSSFSSASVINLANVAQAPNLRTVTANGNLLTLTFDGTVRYTLSNPSAFVVTANNTPLNISGVSVAGNSVLLYLSSAVSSGQLVEVSYSPPQQLSDATTLRDWLGNTVGSISAQVANNITGQDLTPPSLQYAIVNGTSLVLTFSETLNSQAGFTPLPSGFAINVNGKAVNVTQAVVSGATVTLSLASAANYGDTMTLSYTDLSTGNDAAVVQDLAGNDAVSFANINVINNTPDTTPPTLLSATVNGNQLSLLFSESLNASSGYLPALTSMAVTVNGVAVSINAGSVIGDTATLTLGTAVNAGDYVNFNYTAPSGNTLQAFQDGAGNDLLSIANFNVTNLTGLDLTPPSLVSAQVNGTILTLTFSEALASTASFTPGASAFTVSVDGNSATVSGVRLNGTQAVLTLASAVDSTSKVIVGYARPSTQAIQDGAQNMAASFSAQSVSNVTADTTPPSLSSASVAGAVLTLTFSENLATTPALLASASEFAVTVDGQAVDVLSAVSSGNSVSITLSKAVTASQKVSVDYTASTSGTNYLQDSANNKTANFSRTVQNLSGLASIQNATVNGTTLSMIFNQELDANSTHLPPLSAFAVKVNGVSSAVSNLAVSGHVVTLTLGAAVTAEQTVTVNYTGTDNDLTALQNFGGMDVQSFSAPYAVHNLTSAQPVATPHLEQATVKGSTLTLTFSEALDAGVGEWWVNYLPDGQYDASGHPLVTSRVKASGFVNVLGSNNNDSFIIGDQSGLDSARQLGYVQLGNGQGVQVNYYDTSGNLFLALGNKGQANVILESGSSLQKLLTAKLVQSDADIAHYKANRDTVTLKSLSSLTAFLSGYETIDATDSTSSLTVEIGEGDHQIKLGGQTVHLQFDKVVSNTSISTRQIPNSWLDYQYFNFNGINADGLWVGRESDGTVLFKAQWKDGSANDALNVSYEGALSNVVFEVGKVVSGANTSQLRLDKLIEAMSAPAFSTDANAVSYAMTDANTKLYRVTDIVAYSAASHPTVTGGV